MNRNPGPYNRKMSASPRLSSSTLKLRGRLAASSAATFYGVAGKTQEVYGLLLGTHLPDGRSDSSANELLTRMPPHLELARQADGCATRLSQPYDLLMSQQQAREDFEAYRLGKVSSDPDGSVCNAHLVLATKGYLGTPERQAYWRGVLAGLAGKWVEVEVEIQRYSFRGAGKNGKAVQRVGTKLVLRNVEEWKQ